MSKLVYTEFPGLSNNLAWTPQRNLLDADTANIVQSRGGWTEVSGPYSYELLDNADCFGGKVARFTDPDGVTNHNYVRCPATLPGALGHVPVTPSSTVSVRMRWRRRRSGSQSGNCFTTLHFHDVSDARTGEALVSGTSVAPANYEWVETYGTYTVSASTYFVSPQLTLGGYSGDVNDWYEIDYCEIAEVATTEWVPSFAIRGDLHLEFRGSMVDVTAGNDLIYKWQWSEPSYWFSAYPGNAALRLSWFDGSDTQRYGYDSVGHGIANNEIATFGVWLELNGWASGSTVHFFVNGSEYASSNVTTDKQLRLGIEYLSVGSRSTVNDMLEGKCEWALVREGLNGPIVAKYDAGHVWSAA